MAVISMVYLFKKIYMKMISTPLAFAFFAFFTSGRADERGQKHSCSALPSGNRVGAQVVRQRCPILQPGLCSLSFIISLAKRTFQLCRRGGHFNFALTVGW